MGASKLEFVEDLGLYRLLLTGEELALIAALTCRIRLGDNNAFSDAAGNLVGAIEQFEDDDWIENSLNDVSIGLVLEDSDGNVIMAVDATDAIIEVDEAARVNEESMWHELDQNELLELQALIGELATSKETDPNAN
jgi:hypothetical protein